MACSTTRAVLTLEADVPGPEEPWSDVQHGLVRRMQLPFISFVRWSARFDAAGLVPPMAPAQRAPPACQLCWLNRWRAHV